MANYSQILSDSIVLHELRNTKEDVKFIINNSESTSKFPFELVYSYKENNDSTKYELNTLCIYGDTLIDGVAFDQDKHILDRIYIDDNIETKINVDLLEKYIWEDSVLNNVVRFDINDKGVFEFSQRMSELERKIKKLSSNLSFSGNYKLKDENC